MLDFVWEADDRGLGGEVTGEPLGYRFRRLRMTAVMLLRLRVCIPLGGVVAVVDGVDVRPADLVANSELERLGGEVRVLCRRGGSSAAGGQRLAGDFGSVAV